MADNEDQNQDISEEVLEVGAIGNAATVAAQSASAVGATSGAFAIAENPLEEAANAAGKGVGEFLAEIREAATQAGVYLEDKSLQDLGEQLMDGFWSGPETVLEGHQKMAEQLYNTLTDPATWQASGDTASNPAETYEAVADGVLDAADGVRDAGEEVLDSAASGADLLYGAGDYTVGQVQDTIEYAYTTDPGSIASDFKNSAQDLYGTVLDTAHNIGGYLSGYVSGLQDAWNQHAGPQVPEATQQKIDEQAKAERGETQPQPKREPEEPKDDKTAELGM